MPMWALLASFCYVSTGNHVNSNIDEVMSNVLLFKEEVGKESHLG